MSAFCFSLRALLRYTLLFIVFGNLSLAHAQTRALTYAGVNLSGAEFASSQKPGVLNKDYTYPAASDYTYFAGVGMNTIRLPILWERLQPTARGKLDPTQLALLQQAVARAKAAGMYLVIDLHNYAKYYGYKIGSPEVPVSTFTDVWRRLALTFKSDNAVMFGLMNEPNNISASEWAGAAQAAIDAIRKTGANNLILVPGALWTGAHSWYSPRPMATPTPPRWRPSTIRSIATLSRCISIWTPIPAAPAPPVSAPRSAPIACVTSPSGCIQTVSAVSWPNSVPPTTRSATRR